MEKFTKRKSQESIEKKKSNNTLYESDYFKIFKKDKWEYIQEPDNACVIPIIVEENKVLVRMEVIPPYQEIDGREYHLTCISGTIEEGEDAKTCIKRELEEEAGILLRDNVVIEIFDILHKCKSNSSRFHLCVLPLSSYQYDEVIAKGDGSKWEELSKTVKVNSENIKYLEPSDVVTKYLLEEVKRYLNID